MANDFRTPALASRPIVAAGKWGPSRTTRDQPAVVLTIRGRPARRFLQSPVSPRVFTTELFTSGKRLLIMFLGFAFVGYFLNGLIPASRVAAVFGSGNVYSVPLAATLGLPLYINSASLPLIRALLDNGMSQGAALAFMISAQAHRLARLQAR